MTHLLVMLRDAAVVQVMDWTTFQKTGKDSFYISNEGNTTHTYVYVKYDEHIQKYSFDVIGKLVGLTTEKID